MIKHYIIKHICLFSLVLLVPFAASAQIVIDNTMTPTQLVQTTLLGGGVTASNITFNGSPIQIAKFTATGTNLGLSSGVIMATGDCSLAVGPNNSSGTTLPLGGIQGPGDTYLTNLSGQNTFDAAVLEFDFVPTSDSIKFRYVFASEEYLEFVGSINDIFAFVLTGVSTPFPATNIALIPGTSSPVSINNVNDTSYPQYYVDNGDGFTPSGTVQFDGFTTVLTAQAAVICGETYHIKLAIADGSDAVLDSGVFLEAGSFSSTGDVQIIPDVSYSTNDTTMFEGCGDATIAFVRSGNNTNAQTFNYTLSGSATNGADFNNLNGQVTIPAGQDSAFITLNPISDGIPEGVETVTFTVTNTVCNNQTVTSVTIYIQDVVPLTVNAGPDQSTACTGGNNVNLTATPANGVPAYTYSWAPTGEVTQGITVLPANTTTYTVTVTDLCGNTATDDVDVIVSAPQPMILTMSNDTIICQNQVATIAANVQGGNGTVSYVWNDGSQAPSQQVSPPVTTTYTVTVTDLCNQSLTDDVTVTVEPNNAAFTYFMVTNNSVQFTNQSVGFDNLVWWDFGDSTTSTVFAPSHVYNQPGTYIVTLVVENVAGCLDTIQYSLVVRPEFNFYIPNSFTPNSDGVNETFNGKGEGFDVYSMTIYNRWGTPVFTTNSLATGWDGRDKSDNQAPIDVYVYVVKIKVTEDADEIIYRGKVSVIR